MNSSSSPPVADARRWRAVRKSRWSDRLDVAQSLNGLILAPFTWGHMFFVSSTQIAFIRRQMAAMGWK